jgi:ornithine cyclodeaminase/alanine dehydrogenase-like protein (mu-crystallin family)
MAPRDHWIGWSDASRRINRREGAMAIILRESDIEKLATMQMALDAVEQAFRLKGEGSADNTPRRRCRLEKGFLHVMSASFPRSASQA